MARSSPLLITFLTVIAATTSVTGDNKVGICFGRNSDDLPPPFAIVDIVKNNHISKVRLFNTDAPTLQAFKGSGIELMIGVPNENLTYIANGGVEAAANWLKTNIFDNVPANQVNYIAVGNEVLLRDTFYAESIVPAMKNLHQALKNQNLDKKIKLSSPQASSVVGSSSPPSSAAFTEAALPVIRPLLAFLKETGAPLMVNTYPYFAYASDPKNVPLSFTLFSSDAPPVQDNGITYTNMFEASLDAFVVAMEKEGYTDIPLTVTETGWPTAGGVGAEPTKAGVYNNNVIMQALAGKGTPKRPKIPVEVYLFDLLDENLKEGPEFEKHFGIFNLDGSTAFSVRFA
ncbi:glucan endo-1,3-beta-glucosidase-like [Dioscorea cayenensis subsp. rotundata]|uniref:Glucan endo-1,3-beta-glucosidase-like n=1 Tax=Dioscorea cayennensis subsp. rotundata TaxID=55577 RepID=A0AB40B8T2_DIOCR|nr:glucan endo-1,3-beta-glucosidase-like [Dioscorea cayenensis subsp. rotundata]